MVAAIGFDLFLMLIVVAIKAQQFPVATVGWVMVVVVVTMMNRQFPQIGKGEFPGAATTNPRIDFQGALAITLFTLGTGFTSFQNDAVEAGVVDHGQGVFACLGGV